MQARAIFNLNIGVELLENHFMDKAYAFVNHASYRITRIDLIFEGNL